MKIPATPENVKPGDILVSYNGKRPYHWKVREKSQHGDMFYMEKVVEDSVYFKIGSRGLTSLSHGWYFAVSKHFVQELE